jgi:putative membrane protein
MANERTFLAWVRTSIGVMAFGFVVEKFTLFMRQITAFLSRQQLPEHIPFEGTSSIFGIFLVAFGAFLGLLGYIRYRQVELQIEEESYRQSTFLAALLTVVILVCGVFLVIYLLKS